MTFWFMRAANDEAAWSEAESKGSLFAAWQDVPDLSQIGNFHELKTKLKAQWPDLTPETLHGRAERIWRFLDIMMPSDIVAVPDASGTMIACGEITGPYRYQAGEARPHSRAIRWIKREIPIAKLAAKTQALCRSPVEIQGIDEWGLRNDLSRHLSLPVNNQVKYALIVAIALVAFRYAPELIEYLREWHDAWQ